MNPDEAVRGYSIIEDASSSFMGNDLDDIID